MLPPRVNPELKCSSEHSAVVSMSYKWEICWVPALSDDSLQTSVPFMQKRTYLWSGAGWSNGRILRCGFLRFQRPAFSDAADSLPIYCGIVLPKTQLNINTSLGQTLLLWSLSTYLLKSTAHMWAVKLEVVSWLSVEVWLQKKDLEPCKLHINSRVITEAT